MEDLTNYINEITLKLKGINTEINNLEGISGDLEFKFEYLKKLLEKDYSVRTANQSISLFKNISRWEDLFEKDVYNFNLKETQIVFKDFRKPSLTALCAEKSILDKYLYFAYDNKMINLAMHPSFNLKRKDLGDFINKKSRKNKYLTHKEYLELLDECYNYQDKALIVLLWNGFYNKELELIRNLKASDINLECKRIDVEGYDHIIFEDVEIDILQNAAYTEQSYRDMQSDNERQLFNNFIIRSVKDVTDSSVNQDPRVSRITLNSRFRKLITSLNRKDLKIKAITVSGVFFRGLSLIKENENRNPIFSKYMLENGVSILTAAELKDFLLEKYNEEK